MGNPTPSPPLDEDVHSDDDITHEVKDYTGGLKETANFILLIPSQLVFLPRALSSRGAGISMSNVGPSTTGASFQDVSPCYVCED